MAIYTKILICAIKENDQDFINYVMIDEIQIFDVYLNFFQNYVDTYRAMLLLAHVLELNFRKFLNRANELLLNIDKYLKAFSTGIYKFTQHNL